MFSCLFVCTANICRSPIAEGILVDLISRNYPDKANSIHVHSCGVAASLGRPAADNSRAVCSEKEIDIENHQSKPLTQIMLEETDLVLCLSIEHYNHINKNYVCREGQVHLLKAFSREADFAISDSVPDPIGLDIDMYRITFAEISAAIEAILPDIVALADKEHKP